MFLTKAEADAIDAQVARLESRTGVQVVTAVVGKSDTYAELPWKAFALGASLAGLRRGARGPAAAPSGSPPHTALLHAVDHPRRGGRRARCWPSSSRPSRGSSCARRGATSRFASTRSRSF